MPEPASVFEGGRRVGFFEQLVDRFAIGPAERDRWLEHMRAGVEEMGPPDEVERRLLESFEMGAEALRNRDR